MEILNLVRKNVLKLKPYASARDEFSGSASVFLDANENPYPTPYNRYPDPHQVKLKEIIAKIKGVEPASIFLGNGSDEPIDLLIRAFCEPGKDNILIPQPTYGMYAVSAEVNAVEVISPRLTAEFDLDLAAMEKSWNDSTKLIFLCSPNNPTGNLLNREKILEIVARFRGLVIVDEAYIDFTDSPGFLPLIQKHRNLVVLQTLSKAWGLAGIRLGMCFANPEVISILNRIKPPYNISILTQTIAEEQLAQERRKDDWVRALRSEREKLKKALQQSKVVRQVFPSDANFLLVKVTDAKYLYEKLVQRGVIVRDRSRVVGCGECLRITVGTPGENEILISELKTL